jgi:N4-gp56 family major capsid protein
MALTNFGLLTNEQKTIWSMDLWKNARNQSFINKFLGSGTNSMIQHITDLKSSEKGARAVITLLADLQGDGVAGDRTLVGNEEGMQTFEQVIRIDQLRHANRHEGKMADQKSIVGFRDNSKNVLSYWLADRIDQMAFQTLAGVGYGYKPSGAVRTGSDLQYLEFAADVAAPSSKRMLRWDNASASIKSYMTGSNTSAAVTTADFPTWKMFVQLKAYAKDRYIRGVGGDGGQETFHAFLTPQAMAKLKQDTDYNANLRYSQNSGTNDKLFSGDSVKIDGIYLHEFRHVPNTSGASGAVLLPSGGPLHSKYGANGDVDGCQILFCGAQALGMADLGAPEWNEEDFDFKNSQAIAIGKILGFLKPKFGNIYEGNTVEDFGVISCYVAT